MNSAPRTHRPFVPSVATVVTLLGTFCWPKPGDQPVPAMVERQRIKVIDFYPHKEPS